MWVLSEGNVERAVQWVPMSPRDRAVATDSPLHVDAAGRMARAKRRLAVTWRGAFQGVGKSLSQAGKKRGKVPEGGNAGGGVGGNVNHDF